MAVAEAHPRTPTRERLLYSAAELFRRQGYAATGLKQILAEADAPFGSLYHFFPGGKEELGEQVLRTGGQFFLALYESIAADAADLEAALRDFFDGAAQTLIATDYLDACPIATVAGEVASTHPRLRTACQEAFESWNGALERDAVAAGLDPARARRLSLAILSALEGAFLLARAARSIEPIEAARDAALDLTRAALREAGA